MSVSISEIIAGASVHEVPLAGECAGYLVLAAADQAVSAPRRIGPDGVRLHDDGSVRVEGAPAAEETDSEADLRALLDALLLRASSSTPALLRASRRSPGRGIAALVREIETALIPVNRSAAHRALARLERETCKARQAGKLDASPPAVTRKEPPRVSAQPAPLAVPVPTPVPAPLLVVETPALAAVEEIPSLFAPEVESIAALAAEIETRPEPIAVRRSAPPPPSPASSRSPSPPPLPVMARTPSPPPLPVALPETPVLGTRVQSYSDDEMDIEIVLDDELMDDELTGVLPRSAPLEVSAMLEASAPLLVEVALVADALPVADMPLVAGAPPVVDEDVPLVADAPLVTDMPLVTDEDALPALDVALIADMPLVTDMPLVADMPVVTDMPVVADMPPVVDEDMPLVTDMPLVAEMEAPLVADALPAAAMPLVTEVPPVVEVAMPFVTEVPPVVDEDMPLVADALPAAAMPLVTEVPPAVEVAMALVADALPDQTEPSPPVAEDELSEIPSSAIACESHGETLALALAVERVVVNPTPAPRLPMPVPRRSDVEDLLDKMERATPAGGDDLRKSLKGLAGLEPTPPPETELAS